MKTKEEIVKDWLPRYTGKEMAGMGKYILLTNFEDYVQRFAKEEGVNVEGQDRPMPNATSGNISMIDFGMGSANAATIMDLLSAVSPKAVLFLGKCGGLKKKNKVGDMILPIAAIRGEGTSDDYFPREVPALPAFSLQRAVSGKIRDSGFDYWTGTVFTTNRRVWEHDDAFKEHLRVTRTMGIDMETATIFMVGFANGIPSGALLLVSDQPMIREGVKTAASDRKVTEGYVLEHIRVGRDSMYELINNGRSVKHLRFEE